MLRKIRWVLSVCLLPVAVLAADLRTVEWTALMPREDLDALLKPPPEIANIPDGSPEDVLSSSVTAAVGKAAGSRYQQALMSTRVVPAFNGQRIRIAGFVVPLQTTDDQRVTEFFFVPYFGACIHVPPPPPNQMIFVRYDKGFQLDSLYDPFWLEGKLEVRISQMDIGTAAYAMTAERMEPYTETE